MTEVVDAQVVEAGTEMVVRDAPAPGLFHTNDPLEVVEKATRVADALKDVIVRKGLFTNVQGKAHVNVEGWTLLGSMLGVTAVCTSTQKVDDDTWKATVEARDATGRVVGAADALCSAREKRGPWKNADDYARCSMAQTRATSKALKGPLGFVLSLAGYATTPAEEMVSASDVPVVTDQSPVATPSRAQGASGRVPPPPQPARQTSTRSDVTPTDDPWVTGTIQKLGTLDLQKDLRPKLKKLGVVPPSGQRGAQVRARAPRAVGAAEGRRQVD
jgi:hypothetical protein